MQPQMPQAIQPPIQPIQPHPAPHPSHPYMNPYMQQQSNTSHYPVYHMNYYYQMNPYHNIMQTHHQPNYKN